MSLRLLLCAMGGATLATQVGPRVTSDNRVDVTTPLSADGVHPGATIHAALQLDIAPGWHINSNTPLEPQYRETTVQIEEHPHLEVLATRYPPGSLYRVAFAPDTPLDVLEGRVFIYLDLRRAADAPPGVHELLGLALNLTPCVYPMLAVTVSLFGGQSEMNTSRVFGRAVVFVLGICTMYSVLGVTAALSGGLFGAALQSPWVLGGIGVLFVALALGMFGLYEMQAPGWRTRRLGGTTATTRHLPRRPRRGRVRRPLHRTPVALYFAADWCLPCLELDRPTFTNKRVIETMAPIVRLKVDPTTFDSPESTGHTRSVRHLGSPGHRLPGMRTGRGGRIHRCRRPAAAPAGGVRSPSCSHVPRHRRVGSGASSFMPSARCPQPR